MAATAYAAAVSLLNTMDQIQIHPFLSTYFNKYSIESLREKVDFFVDIVEKYSDAESQEAEDLLRRIADVAHEAEEVINVEAADRVRDGSTRKRFRMSGKLKKITREMDCIKEKAMNAKEETGFKNPYSPPPLASSSTPPPTATTMKSCSYAEDLMRRMAAVALKAMPRKLQREIKVMDSKKEKVIEAEENTGFLNQQLTSSVPSSSSSAAAAAPPANVKTTTMVGFEGYLEQLLDELTGHHSGRQILPIVGMGGIGKTTLATHVYRNSLMLHHFDIRAWVTVSQEFTARNIILQALSYLGGSNSNTDKTDDQLGEELYKILSGRRYLIVFDDIWSVEAWEKIKFYFPENNNRSRIVVTTRESELVDYFGSSAIIVDFLDEKNSWELFCEKTFAKEGCPPELEEIGKEIVEKCKGLPLTITVFGGLLRKSPRTREYWEMVATDKSLILNSGEDNIKPLSILNLSYKHLPVWLKSCFLYLGLFPEDHEIDVSQLIKLWVAEGLIRSKTEQSLEEIAESYAKELVDRNLLLVGELRINKKLKSCRVHDIVRELCLRIGEKEKYFCVQRDIDGMRHYIVDEVTARLFYPRESQEMLPLLFYPLIFEGQRAAPFKSRLLRVSLVRDRAPLHSSSQHVNLRFLFPDNRYATSLMYRLDMSWQIFWSLQTLIVHGYTSSFLVPRAIWKMPQLRHIDILEFIYLGGDLPSPTCEDDVIVLYNLQTFKRVKNLVLSEEVCKRIPNIKEMEISYRFYEHEGSPYRCDEASSCYHLQNLGCFNKLESLKLYYARLNEREYRGGESLHKLELPSSLKELSLCGWNIVWSAMAMIGSLPSLQFLELANDVLVGSKWDCVEGGFLCLEHLFICNCRDLINWNADSSSFPVLEKLSLTYLSELEEIPSVIGEIPTLERMDVEYCSESVVMSAIKILEEQQSFGNQSLQLTLKFYTEGEAVKWRGKIEEMGITCQNLHIYIGRSWEQKLFV